MRKVPATLAIGIPVYPGVDPLDVAGPYEVFCNTADEVKGRCAVTVHVLGATGDPVPTRFGMKLVPTATFADVPALDVLWVPGGGVDQLYAAMHDAAYLEALRGWAEGARFVTSVCEGAMLLASAGLLDGCRATTHWAFIPCFDRFPLVTPVGGRRNRWPRFVVDPPKPASGALGTRVTGAGISAGLDEAFQLVVMIFGRKVAKRVQVAIQYFPDPPVKAKLRPATSCPLPAP